MNLRILSIILLFAVLAVGFGLYLRDNFSPTPLVEEDKQNNANEAVEADNGSVKIGIEGDASGVTIKEVPTPTAVKLPPLPNLSRPINIPSSLPEESKVAVKAKIERLEADLKKDPTQYANWLELGLSWKFIDDFEGARLCWEYAAAIGPDGFIAFNNLGDLYAYYLNSTAKAELNYKLALAKGPDQIYVYRAVYDFYRNVLKNDALAKKTLEDGIAKNPKTSKDLKYLLDNFNSQ